MSLPYNELSEKLIQIFQRLESETPERERFVSFSALLKSRGSLLVGPRGTGKTTFLIRHAKTMARTFYLSLDNPLVTGVSIYEFGDWLFQNGYDTLICDEVHFADNWSQQLKALYDAHPKKKIIASDSSTLILRKGVGDLSRRFVSEKFPYLSFHEYLYLKKGVRFDTITWPELLSEKILKFAKGLSSQAEKHDLNFQHEFKSYLQEGVRPYFLEGHYQERTQNVLEKMIYVDIPYFVPEIKERHLQLMKNVVGHLATSPIPTLTIDSLSRDWAIGKPTIYNLLEVMSESGILNIIPQEGVRGKSKGKKIFFADPSFYHSLNGLLGNVREAYFAMAVKSMGLELHCPKDDSDYDFKIGKNTFEVGGRNKKKKNADFAIKDDIDLPGQNSIPLWVMGFLGKES
jgi:hypothetical protein